MAGAAQQRLDHGGVAEEAAPFFIAQVRCNDCGVAVIALLHQLEEDVALLGPEIDVPQLINQQNVKPEEAIQQLARGTIGQRSIHLIEQILCVDELAAIAILESLQQQSRCQSRFAHAGWSDQN